MVSTFHCHFQLIFRFLSFSHCCSTIHFWLGFARPTVPKDSSTHVGWCHASSGTTRSGLTDGWTCAIQRQLRSDGVVGVMDLAMIKSDLLGPYSFKREAFFEDNISKGHIYIYIHTHTVHVHVYTCLSLLQWPSPPRFGPYMRVG